jgi:hypothetical protein
MWKIKEEEACQFCGTFGVVDVDVFIELHLTSRPFAWATK